MVFWQDKTLAETEQLKMASTAISIQSEAGVGAALGGEGMSGFEELYLKHCRRVYSICLRMLANVAEAEDLTQEIFIQLHHKLGSFRGEAAFITWLHRLTVNQVLMYFRRRSTQRRQPTDTVEICEVVDSATLSPQVVPIIDRIALDEAIGQLASGYRAVFVVCDIEGYNHEEAAKLLGCSVGTTKSQLHKARMRLRQLLMSGPS
jgi:RNA polymerase sigma-70 factor (ECF subfamily)